MRQVETIEGAKEPGKHRASASCEVARLADETVSLIRALYMVVPVEDRPEYARSWPSAIEDVNANRSATPRAIWRSLYDRIKAIEEFAPTRVATSRKGALFQLYLAGAASRNIEPDVSGLTLPREAKEQVDASVVKLTSLIRSALSALEAEGDLDGDLQILRRYFFDPDVDAEEQGDFLVERVEKKWMSA